MDPYVTGSIISSGAGILGNLFGIGRGKRETRRNKELMKYQNSINLDFWNKQNEYNRPINQMKRFKEAGLNPALMYGQGNPGNASSLQSANYTPHKEATVDTSLLQNVGLLGAQIDAIKTDVKGKELDIVEKGGTKKQRQAVYQESIRDLKLKNAQTKAQNALLGLDRQFKKGQLRLQKKDIDLAEKGIYTNSMQTIIDALDLNLKTKEGKEEAKFIIYGLLGSQMAGQLAGALFRGVGAIGKGAKGTKTVTRGVKNGKPFREVKITTPNKFKH